MKIHLWEAYNAEKISVDLKKGYKDKIKTLIKKDLYKIAKKINIIPARLYDYFIYQKTPIPLNVLLKLSKIFEIDLLDIEKNVIMYKQMFVPVKNSVKNPKLPIEINPYFTSIIANLFFDGSVPADGKGTYYNQKNNEIMNDFIRKIIEVFGDVRYSIKKDHKGVLKCRIPRVIGEICKNIYEVNSFGTFDSRIPKRIFDLNKEYKIAFVLTAIIDEGSIAYDGSVIFGVNNKLLCEDVKKLCEEIGLNTTKVNQKSKSNHYYFYIKSIKELIDIINFFKKKYPLISLNYKENRLRKAIEIKKQKFSYTKEFADKRKSLILKELKNKKCSINYLSDKFLIPPRTIRRYMYNLMKNREIKRKKIGNEYYYDIFGGKPNLTKASLSSL